MIEGMAGVVIHIILLHCFPCENIPFLCERQAGFGRPFIEAGDSAVAGIFHDLFKEPDQRQSKLSSPWSLNLRILRARLLSSGRPLWNRARFLMTISPCMKSTIEADLINEVRQVRFDGAGIIQSLPDTRIRFLIDKKRLLDRN